MGIGTGMGTGTGIAVGVIVIVVSIHTAATTDTVLPTADSATAVRVRCHPCRIGGPVSGIVVDEDAVTADDLAVLPLLPLGATDPTAGATTKTLNGTAAATAMATAATATATAAAATVTAMATEEKECDGCNGADP